MSRSHTYHPVENDRLDIPVKEVIALFNAGKSILHIAGVFGCSRNVITSRLLREGITVRSRKDAAILRMSQTTPEYRQQITSSAHAIVKGKRYTFEELCHRASSRQASFDPTSLKGYEATLYHMLTSESMDPIPQHACGPYNLDFTIARGRISVEVFGGGFHSFGKHQRVFRKRAEYIRDSGIVQVIIWCLKKRPIERGCIEQLMTLCDRLRLDEAMFCQQYVISSDGQPSTYGRKELEYLTGVMRFHQGQYVI